jgi:ATP-dependent RNA helicase DHX57
VHALEAAIEFLILSIPECDLPQRFLPSINSSNPFITSAHSGEDDLKRRWTEDKAVKEAGWPAHAIKLLTSNPKIVDQWDLLIVSLGRRLIGEDWTDQPDSPADIEQKPYQINVDEVEALGAHFIDATQLVMPLFSAPIQVHMIVSANQGYPRHGYAPMYITSTTAPAYVRLHLLSQVLVAMRSEEFIEPGEGFCMAVMRVLEEEWAKIEDNGPPDMSAVLKYFMPSPAQTSPVSSPVNIDDSTLGPLANRNRRRRASPRSDGQIKQDFETLCGTDKVRVHLFPSYFPLKPHTSTLICSQRDRSFQPSQQSKTSFEALNHIELLSLSVKQGVGKQHNVGSFGLACSFSSITSCIL